MTKMSGNDFSNRSFQLAGQAICRRLVADGYRVIGSARRIPINYRPFKKSSGEAFYPLQMDVTDLSQVDRELLPTALLKLGREWMFLVNIMLAWP